ncbi:phage tail protein [Pseudomonas cremoricolorata]|uniref:phage tail protein n=1 Tax=Pseudomonas cremoricolorata TaxID=157783 RepID=UPI0004145EC9|nr:phage tail protein [Pseudomonas cremoricolorata]
MTDQTSQFFAVLTDLGAAKLARANALGLPWTVAQMAVGDANGTQPLPDPTQTRLINERRRAPLNQLSIDPRNAAIIIAEQVLPEEVGGFWIRELALFDSEGDMVAVANCPPSFKPLLAQGSGRTQVLRIHLLVSNTANIELRIDPAVVLATRDYVDQRLIEVLPATRPAGSYTRVEIDRRGVVIAGSNPSTLADYGITDAYTRKQTDARLATKVEADWVDVIGLVSNNTSIPYMRARTGEMVHLVTTQDLPRNTCKRGTPGWWRCADTGLLRQRVAVHIGDVALAWTGAVVWPIAFPNHADSVLIGIALSDDSPGTLSASYSDLTKTGCTLRVDEWDVNLQYGLTLFVVVEGY